MPHTGGTAPGAALGGTPARPGSPPDPAPAGQQPLGPRRRHPGNSNPENDTPRNRHPRASRARRSRPRRIVRMLALLACVLLVASGGTYVWADSGLNRKVDLGKIKDRAPAGKGTNYLIVGSDSREGLSEQDRKNLHTGVGRRRPHRLDDPAAHRRPRHHDDEPAARLVGDHPVLRPPRDRQALPRGEEQAERGLLDGRTRPARTDRRAQHGSAHRPLRGDRLRRLRGGRGRGRRREDVPRPGHQGQEVGRGPEEGLPDPRRLQGARVRPPAPPGGRGRSGPYQNQQKFLSALAHKAANRASPSTRPRPSRP